jgi:hypothetical protein
MITATGSSLDALRERIDALVAQVIDEATDRPPARKKRAAR